MRSPQTIRLVLLVLSVSLGLNLGSGCQLTTSTEDPASPEDVTSSTTGTVKLPATGQVISFADDDDGALQLGETMPAALRFEDPGDGTIIDHLTGLMWLKDASCLIRKYPNYETDGWADGFVPWADALQFIADINNGTLSACQAGYTDWRLPNVNELESLVNAGQGQLNQWLIGAGFEAVEANDYWTSTTDPSTTETFAYVVDMADGNVSVLGNKGSVINSVWPVRGTSDASSATTQIPKTGQTTSYAAADDGDLEKGTAWPDPRFTDNGDGTVTDHLAGLVWLQDGACLGGDTWNGALTMASRFNQDPDSFQCRNLTATHSDWRVPNRKELFSLADFSQRDPALPNGHPFVGISGTDSYWSSTTYAGDGQRAWHGDLRDGDIGYDLKVNGHRVLLVRHTVARE